MQADHTFVICAYKESRYLEECIDSLMSQTVKSNVIMVTSTPNDFINSVAQKYGIELFTHIGNGIGSDWNFGLSMVKTKYATIAHQDDLYDKEYLKCCLFSMQKYKNPLICYTDYYELKDERLLHDTVNLKIKRVLAKTANAFKNNRFIRRRLLAFGDFIACPSVTYNMEALCDFKFDETLSVTLDWDAWYRICKQKGTLCYCNKTLFTHRLHEESETSNAIMDSRRTDEDKIMFNKFWVKPFSFIFYSLYKNSLKTKK